MSQFIDDALLFYADHTAFPFSLEEKITYEELDGFDFFNRVKEKTGDDSLSDLDSVYIKDEENGKFHFLIRDTVAFQKNNFSLEVLYSQISNISLEEDKHLRQTMKRFNNFLFRKAYRGMKTCLSFYAIHLSQSVMSIKYADSKENPYNEEESKRLGADILKQALEKENISRDERMSMLFYALAKISVYEKNEGIYDIRPFIKDELLKKPVQQMYALLAGKQIYDVTAWSLGRLENISKKVYSLLPQEEK